jgi:hypothetical protein
MAKQGQHENDSNDPRKAKGNNHPDRSQTITTGSVKKQETYKKQAALHQDPGKPAQAQKNDWNEDTRDKPTIEGATRARNPRSGRSGSDSDADSATRGH